jgi:hypothetical protein
LKPPWGTIVIDSTPALGRFGVGTAEDQVLDQRRVEIGAREQAAHHLRGQPVGPDLGQGALAGEMEGGTGISGDHGFHGIFSD